VAAERIWPALALAGAVARGVDQLPVNFLRPKLAPPKPARVNRKWAAGAAAILLVALGVAGLWWWTAAAETKMTRLESELQSKQHDIQQAQEYVASVSYVRGFFETRPPVLECLRDLAQTFGREERIWTTTYSMRENGRGQLQGRAADQQTVMALADRLKEHPNFAEVRLTDMREAAAGGRSRGSDEIGFTMTFVYVPRDNAQEARP
jgi:hypothetical protein